MAIQMQGRWDMVKGFVTDKNADYTESFSKCSAYFAFFCKCLIDENAIGLCLCFCSVK